MGSEHRNGSAEVEAPRDPDRRDGLFYARKSPSELQATFTLDHVCLRSFISKRGKRDRFFSRSFCRSEGPVHYRGGRRQDGGRLY